jgi:hypothetical protein
MATVPDYVTTDELIAEVERLRARVAELEAELAEAKPKPVRSASKK